MHLYAWAASVQLTVHAAESDLSNHRVRVGNTFTEDGFDELANMLEVNTTLRRLNIGKFEHVPVS
eukprot:6182523-Pleurochrysis_carterae.AAC.5